MVGTINALSYATAVHVDLRLLGRQQRTCTMYLVAHKALSSLILAVKSSEWIFKLDFIIHLQRTVGAGSGNKNVRKAHLPAPLPSSLMR